jgi:aminoglycoside phosphotransferase family enzyme/predicted kinase
LVAKCEQAAAVDPQQLEAALALASGAPVSVRETHISWVFVVGDRAFKLKKPLVLPFLDYGTPARRRAMCQEEVRLNRRLAPELYVGVRAVSQTRGRPVLSAEDDPEAIDYLVEMRRYDDRHTLAATLARGELQRDSIRALARTLVAFHASCPQMRDQRCGARAIELEATRNLAELLEVGEPHAGRRRIHRLARFMAAFVGARAATFDRRAMDGRVCECHGDLRAEHVVLEPKLGVVDCVEFDRSLRTLDVADDLAFLVMDLTALGGERFARELVEDYRAAGGDCGDDALLSYFAIHRALVRAKVLLVRAGQYPGRSTARADAATHAHELLALAERFAWRARLPLVIMICGVPGSGKSYLGHGLADAARLPMLSSDVVRKRLAGVKATATMPQERYSSEYNHATYAELGRCAAQAVADHGGAIIDATFRHREDRDAFAASFAGATPRLFVECVAPAEVLERRAARRDRDTRRVSDATLDVVRRERTSFEPLEEVPADMHITLRTDRELERILADLMALLDESLHST